MKLPSLVCTLLLAMTGPLPANAPPVLQDPIPDQTNTYGSTFNYTFPVNAFSDPDSGQTLTYTAANLPPGLAFDGPSQTFSGTASNAGVYIVTVTATDDGSPPLSTNDTFTVTVATAPLIVTADTTNRPYGQANPPLTGSLTGVTNGDNITVSFTTTANAGSPPGGYPITPLLDDPGNRLSNYIITTNAGVLTVIDCSTLTLSPPVLPGATKDAPYSSTFTTVNGTAPYSYALTSGGLPDGLTLSSAGLLSGTPTNAGGFVFTVQSSDSNGCTISSNYTVSVAGPLYEGFVYAAGSLNGRNGGNGFSDAWGGSGPSVISNSFSVGGPVMGNHVEGANGTYSRRLSESIGAPGTVRYISAVVAYVRHTFGTPPPSRVGLMLNGTSGTGLFIGKPSAGSSLNLVLENAAGGSQAVGPAINPPGSFFFLVVKCEFFTGNDRFTLYVNPTLGQAEPASGTVKFDSDVGTVTNIALTITGADAFTSMGFDEIRLAPTYAAVTPSCPTITLNPASLPNGAYGTPYSQTVGASGGAAPYTFTVTSGVIPGGLTLSTSGLVSGTPSAGGTYSFNVAATDTNGCAGNRNYSITIPCGTVALSPMTLPPVIRGTPYSQTLTASGGIAPYTFSVAFGGLLSGFGLSSSGTFSGTATNYAVSSFGLLVTDAASCSQIFNYTLSALPNRWVGDGSANQWNLTAANWDRGLFHNNDDVLFDDTGSNNLPVNITTAVSPASISVDNTKTFTFSGSGGITGTSSLSKSSSGELRVATSNSYSGLTVVSGGLLTVQNSNALGTTNGATTVTNTGSVQIDGNGLNIAEPLGLSAGYVSYDCSPTNAALNNLGGTNTWSGPVTLGSALGFSPTINSAAGLLTLNSPTPISGSNGLSVAGAGDVAIASGIDSSLGILQKYGSGTLTLTGTNASSAGMISYCDGTIAVFPPALGFGQLQAGSGTIEIRGGGNVVVSNDVQIFGGRLRLAAGTSATLSYGGLLRWPDNYTSILQTMSPGDTLTINPAISGDFYNGFGSLHVTGPGKIVINSGLTYPNQNAYQGYWYLEAGTLRLNHVDALGARKVIYLFGGTLQTGVDAGGLFAAETLIEGNVTTIQPGRNTSGAGVSNYFGDLVYPATNAVLSVVPGSNLTAGSTADVGFGGINLSYPAASATLDVQNSAGVNGRVTVAGGVSGLGTLNKSGNGTLILMAGSAYDGGTIVSNGVLKVFNTDGSATGTGDVVVLGGGTLMGTGRISGAVTIKSGGTLAPGSSIGTLSLSNRLVFKAGSTCSMEVAVAPRSSDLARGLTNVTYGGTLVVTKIGLIAYTNGTIFKLFDSVSYNGVFATILPAIPKAGLQWDITTLAVDGNLRIVTGTNQAPFVANPIPDQNAAYGAPFSFVFAANTFADPDADQSLMYRASGMPPGITFNAATRAFSGSTTARGIFDVTVIATDNGPTPMSTSASFNIVVPQCPAILVSPSGVLPQPTVGSAYAQTLTASGGLAPHGFAVTAGALPDGMTVSGSGILGGTPATAGSYSFTVTATDSENCSGSASYFMFVRTNGPGTVTLTTARSSHAATLLPNGKLLVAGGSDYNYYPLASAELYDAASGRWTETAPMNSPRTGPTATLLANGQVLVAGGDDSYGFNPVSSAETYDPATGAWTPTAPMVTPHFYHTATLLRDGKVLVTGTDHNDYTLMSKAELYDPATRTWTATGSMKTGRYQHTATLLSNGKVLVAGGSSFDNTGGPHIQASAEIYDPLTGTWSPAASMQNGRYLHTATLLPDGRTLIAGGYSGNVTASAELYDVAAGTWSAANPLPLARYTHSSTLLPNGKVLIAGGYTDSGSISNEVVFDPASGLWTASGSLTNARSSHTATMLPNGRVLFVAGFGTTGSLASVELFDPAVGTWMATNGLGGKRYDHTANLLPSGDVLVAGGNNFFDNGGGYLSSAEIYKPQLGIWTPTAPMTTAREAHTATLLGNGKVLVAGGANFNTDGAGYLFSAELFDPVGGTWTLTGPLTTGRWFHTATLLPNGKVLIAGGQETNGSLADAQVYDPALGTWTATGPMNRARVNHRATLLVNGKVLIAGGENANGYPPETELYDPAAGIWTLSGSMSVGRSSHTMTLLADGRVLVAGGAFITNNHTTIVFAGQEIYDPAAGVWTTTGELNTSRYNHTATLLPNGKVLVTSGYNHTGLGNLASAELYDPATGTWTTTGSLPSAYSIRTATLLSDGKVLVAGGQGVGFNTATNAELYEVGLGFSPSWQPQVTAITSPLFSGDSLMLSGSGFRGVSGGSSGTSQDSPADYPLVQWRSLESGQTLFIPGNAWSINSYLSVPITGLPVGYAMVTIFVNSIPGTSSIISFLGARSIPIQVFASGPAPAFCWSTNASTAILEYTDSLAPPINWQPATNSISVNGTNNCISITPSQALPRRFFRLRMQ